MNINFISHLMANLGYVITIAFLFTRINIANLIINREKKTRKDIIILSIFFSILSILGTYIGLDFKGAILNTRNIGVIVGGILGGPYVGIISGLVAGIHRFFLNNFTGTALPCGIATIIGGFISAFIYTKIKLKNKIFYGFLVGIIVQNIEMALILVMSTNYEIAKTIVQNIYLPMVFMNPFGIVILILIVQNIIEKNEILAANQAKLALEIANKTLPFFREGESLNQVCKIIANSLEAKAVVITDRKNIIASFSKDINSSFFGEIKSEATKKVLKTGEIIVVFKDDNNLNDFSYISKNIKSCIILPLREKDSISGTLKIFFDTTEKITEKNRYLIIGLSNLISTQMEISKIEKLVSLVKYSEYKALQSQINPHFLFNVLNTLTSYIRINPDRAREIIIDLSDYLRYNLNNNFKNVELIRELKQINSYMRIEKARFGEKIKIFYEVDKSLYNIKIPSLIIQPLVENSIKHGLLKKKEGGYIKIKIKKIKNEIFVLIEDNGVGIKQNIIDNLDKKIDENIGLKNVHHRLKLLYGEGLKIERLEEGTKIEFKMSGGNENDYVYNSRG